MTRLTVERHGESPATSKLPGNSPRWPILAAPLLLTIPTAAYAHGGEASIVLLLPTGYYLLGAAFAVLASFLLLAMIPASVSSRLGTMRLKLATVTDIPHVPISLLSFAVLAVLIAAGISGTRDPVENPLPTFIWTIWWVCFTILQAITGPLWPHLNPWTGPLALLRRLTRRPLGERAFAALPAQASYAIAFLQFAAFAWFELVDLAPSDPDRLAAAVALYWLVNLAGAMVFSEAQWMRHAEPFSIFFALIGRLSPFDRQPADERRTQVSLVWPGHGLISQPALPLIAVFFVLLTLSTVSFDGLSRTFLWLAAIGINPLEFPGRSEVVLSSSIGIVLTFAALAAAYLLAVLVGCLLARQQSLWKEAAGCLIYSIVPIALAFQSAHYLTSVLVDGQNFLIAMSDPFSLGWNLIGTAEWHSTTSFLNTLSGVTAIFNTETIAIALGHIIGIVMAHLIAVRLFDTPRQAVLSQIPLAALMVFYTAFGLWLLSTPRI